MSQCTPDCTNPTATTYYLFEPFSGSISEKVVSGGNTTWRDYIVNPDGQIVAERSKTGSAVTWTYFVDDHLGSPATITDASHAIVERDSFDAWGKRRNADASDDPGCTISSVTSRGYTGHEMIDPLCLINMNARLYDPALGLFLSADTMVPNPFDRTSYNRYAYVNDNPFSFVDPSGHCWTGTRTCPAHIQIIDSNVLLSEQLASGGDSNYAAFMSGGTPMWGILAGAQGQLGGKGNAAAVGPFESCDRYGCYTYAAQTPPDSGGSPETVTVTGGQFYSWDQIFGEPDFFFGAGGVLASAAEYGAGSATIGNNWRPYLKGWPGNRFVQTLSIAKYARGLGAVFLTGSVFYDVNAYLSNDPSMPLSKLSLNLGVDAVSLLGPEGAGIAAAYWGIDTFYPGGIDGYMTDLGNMATQYPQAFYMAPGP